MHSLSILALAVMLFFPTFARAADSLGLIECSTEARPGAVAIKLRGYIPYRAGMTVSLQFGVGDDSWTIESGDAGLPPAGHPVSGTALQAVDISDWGNRVFTFRLTEKGAEYL